MSFVEELVRVVNKSVGPIRNEPYWSGGTVPGEQPYPNSARFLANKRLISLDPAEVSVLGTILPPSAKKALDDRSDRSWSPSPESVGTVPNTPPPQTRSPVVGPNDPRTDLFPITTTTAATKQPSLSASIPARRFGSPQLLDPNEIIPIQQEPPFDPSAQPRWMMADLGQPYGPIAGLGLDMGPESYYGQLNAEFTGPLAPADRYDVPPEWDHYGDEGFEGKARKSKCHCQCCCCFRCGWAPKPNQNGRRFQSTRSRSQNHHSTLAALFVQNNGQLIVDSMMGQSILPVVQLLQVVQAAAAHQLLPNGGPQQLQQWHWVSFVKALCGDEDKGMPTPVQVFIDETSTMMACLTPSQTNAEIHSALLASPLWAVDQWFTISNVVQSFPQFPPTDIVFTLSQCNWFKFDHLIVFDDFAANAYDGSLAFSTDLARLLCYFIAYCRSRGQWPLISEFFPFVQENTDRYSTKKWNLPKYGDLKRDLNRIPYVATVPFRVAFTK